MRLVLASGSPRRREILTALGLTFEVRPTGADETPREGERALDLARRVARAKCEAAMREGSADVAFLAADTVVDVDGVPLNKPESDDDARRMLRLLSGRRHFVHTALALAVRGVVHLECATSEVVFASLDAAMIDRYVAGGEGRDKAGAYAVQGMGAGLVREVHGSPSNVIGLPAAETAALLVEHGVIACWPPQARA
jgi:septum formation protein